MEKSSIEVYDKDCVPYGSGSHIENLPTEVLYLIFDYLPPRTLHNVIRLVCKKFTYLVSRDAYYMVRFKKKYIPEAIEYPLLKYYNLNGDNSWKSGQDVTWSDLTIRTDIREHVWGGSSPIEHKIFSVPHSTTVDTVRILQNGTVCVSGGRDRLLCLWNIAEFPESDPPRPIKVQYEAHEGWVWNIASHEQGSFYTCGWDMYIKHWSVSTFTPIQILRTERLPMCLSSIPGLLAAGLHSGKLALFDPRIGKPNGHHSEKLHRGTITGIEIRRDHQIFTIGEDRKMASYDIRAQKTIQCDIVNNVHKTCPRSLGIYRDLIYIGDSKGHMNIFQVDSDDWKPILRARVGQDRAVNAILPSLEGVIVGTSDVGIRFIRPCKPVKVVYEIKCSGEVTSLDMKNNIIVAGCSDSRNCVHVLKGESTHRF